MNALFRYLPLLVLFTILISVTALILNSLSGLSLPPEDIIILTASFSLIAAITLTIFLRGRNREPDSRAMHTLVAISLKFLLDMILALLWFFISKKNSLTSVFVFFVIYLTLTLFTVITILKILKIRSL